jgi:hypothetical protein
MKQDPNNCGFLTVAFGDSKYIQMAENLVISYINTCKGGPLEFTVIASARSNILFPDFVNWQVVDSPLFQMGLEFKLHLNKFSNKQFNIFIDCDSLIYADILPLFDRFNDNCILSPLVHAEKSGEWCGASVERVCSKMDLESLLEFNGGFYYFKDCQELNILFLIAQSMKKHYNALGFKMLGNSYNEEPLISLALSVSSYSQYLEDDGSVMSDLVGRVDFTGFSSLTSAPLIFNTKKNWLSYAYSPRIVHYGSGGTRNFSYIRDSWINRLVYSNVPGLLCKLVVVFLNAIYSFKKVLRANYV